MDGLDGANRQRRYFGVELNSTPVTQPISIEIVHPSTVRYSNQVYPSNGNLASNVRYIEIDVDNNNSLPLHHNRNELDDDRASSPNYQLNSMPRPNTLMPIDASTQRRSTSNLLDVRSSPMPSSASPRSGAKSPGPKVTVVPRKGSFETRASFRNMHVPQTPEEKRKMMQKRSGPASRNTVITVAGLFTVGLMFISSGIIVLSTPNNQTSQLQITGWVFLGVGILMLIACGLLQRKNWVRYMDQMDNDLYFLKLGSNPVWNLMKLDLLDVSFYQKKLEKHDKDKDKSKVSSDRMNKEASMSSPADVQLVMLNNWKSNAQTRSPDVKWS